VTQTLDPIGAWRALLLAHSRAVRAIEQELLEADVISLAWYDVLLELNAAPDRELRMQDLALRAVLSRTRVSRVVTELETNELVMRVADPNDGRATLARITAAGRAALRKAAPFYLRGIDQHFNQYLTVTQQEAITNGLQRVINAHNADLDPRR
jgi:DNA-binding MarR family transcriptional regulator